MTGTSFARVSASVHATRSRRTNAVCALAVALALVVAGAGEGRARDMSGRLGVGAQVEDGPLAETLSVRYWVSHLGLQVLFGMASMKSKPGVHGFVEWRPGGRVIYALTRTRLTNLFVGGGLSSVIRKSKDRGGDRLAFDAVIGLEYHLSEVLGLSGHVTLTYLLSQPAEGQPDGEDAETDGSGKARLPYGIAWGGSFHFYF